VGLPFAAVDAIGGRAPELLEVNASPGLEALEAATGVEADSWIVTNAQFFAAISAQIIANTTIRFFVALAIAFGIAAVLIVSVVQKSKEIGILRAMGASRGQVLRVFLLQGAVMALVGSLLGSALSLAFLALFHRIARNPDGTVMFLIEIDAPLLLVTAVGATLVGLLAAALPARLAARLDPAVAIRG